MDAFCECRLASQLLADTSAAADGRSARVMNSAMGCLFDLLVCCKTHLVISSEPGLLPVCSRIWLHHTLYAFQNCSGLRSADPLPED